MLKWIDVWDLKRYSTLLCWPSIISQVLIYHNRYITIWKELIGVVAFTHEDDDIWEWLDIPIQIFRILKSVFYVG